MAQTIFLLVDAFRIDHFEPTGDRALNIVLLPMVDSVATDNHSGLASYLANAATQLGTLQMPLAILRNPGMAATPPESAFWTALLDKKSLVPVPFPVGTAFDIELETKGGGSWTYSSAIPGIGAALQPGEDPVLSLPAAEWPAVASASYIRPIAVSLAQLTPAQREEAMDWLVGAAANLKQLPAGGPYNDLRLLIAGVQDPQTENPASYWRKILSTGGLDDKLYAGFVERRSRAINDLGRFQPPLFKLLATQFSAEQLFEAKGFNVASYAALFWNFLTGPQGMFAKDRDQTVKALGRYYGFGERLRWLKLPPAISSPLSADNKRIMVIEETSSRLPHAFTTNGYSLLGHVLRIALPKEVTSIKKFAIGVSAGALTDPIWRLGADGHTPIPDPTAAGQIAQMLNQVTSFTPKPGSEVRLERRSAGAGLRVNFAPLHGGLLPWPPRLANGNVGDWREMPQLLLDALTPMPAVSLTSSPQSLPYTLALLTPPRTAVKVDDIHDDPLKRLNGNLAAGYRARVRVAKRLRVAAEDPADPYVYDIAFTADRPQEEIAWLNTQLGDPTTRLEVWPDTAATPQSAVQLAWTDIKTFGSVNYPLPLVRVLNKAKIAEIRTAFASAEGGPGFLVIKTSTAGKPYFNLIDKGSLPDAAKPGEKRDLIALSSHFAFMPWRSSDQLIEKVALTYSSPTTPVDDPSKAWLGHFSSFNKFRIGISEQMAGRSVQLTYPDAMLPVKGSAPTFEYDFNHDFSRELDEDHDTSLPQNAPTGGAPPGYNARTPEHQRYAAVRTPSTDRWLTATAEHQYSVKFDAVGALEAPLRLAFPVRNPAALHAPNPAGNNTWLLSFECDGATPLLTLHIDWNFLVRAFDRVGGTASPNVLNVLRSIYESLSDIQRAQTGAFGASLKLVVEAWSFSNEALNSARQGPDFLNSMRCLGIGTIVLAQWPNPSPINELCALLGSTFDEFRRNVDAQMSTPVRKSFSMNLADSLWSWTTVEQVPKPISAGQLRALFKTKVHVVRAGLQIARSPTDILDANSVDKSRLHLVEINSDNAFWREGTGLPDQFDSQKAADELVQRIRGPWTLDKTWLTSIERLPGASGGTPTDQEKLGEDAIRSHFGEVAQYLSAPVDALTIVPTVCDFFYVPLGFLPPAPLADFNGDDSAQLEFSEYLARFMQSVVDGTTNGEVGVKATTNDKADAVREELLDWLRKTGGGLMAGLLSPVHKTPAKATPALIGRVNTLLGAAKKWSAEAASWFAETPGDFSRLRAMGLMLFEPSRFDQSLYTVRLNKRIRDPLQRRQGQQAGEPLIANDTEDFTAHHIVQVDGQPPFMLDGLEAEFYDSEFSLLQNRYVQNGKLVSDHSTEIGRIGEQRIVDWNLAANYVALRGDAQGITAEDVIEANAPQSSRRRNFEEFAPASAWQTDPVGKATERSIEVNPVHWNRFWRITDPVSTRVTDWRYLVPTRVPPIQPQLLVPRPSGSDEEKKIDPRSSAVFLSVGESPTDYDAFATKVAACLDKKRSVKLSLGQDANSPSAIVAEFSGAPSSRCIIARTELARARDWYRYDTVLAHHYFLCHEDRTLPSTAILISPDAPERAGGTPPPLMGGSKLLDQFEVWRKRKSAATGTPMPPLPQDELADLVNEVTGGRWNALYAPRNPADFPTLAKVSSVVTVRSDGALSLAHTGPGSADGIGNVVAVELADVVDAGTVQPGRIVLRVTVLEEPWSSNAVSISLKRNFADVDLDGTNDIQQAFELDAPWSDSSIRTNRFLFLGPQQFADYKAAGLVGAMLETGISAGMWRAADPLGSTPEVSLVSPVLKTIDAEIAQNFRMWSQKAKSPDLTVRGVIEHWVPDALFELAPAMETGDVGRSHFVSRQFAGSGGGENAADQLGTMLTKIDRRLVPSDRPMLRVIWWDKRGHRVVEILWPFRFKP